MIDPKDVHSLLGRYQLADGLPMVLDLENSKGAWLRDAATGQDHLDFFTCFASWPVGYNHPSMAEPSFVEEIQAAGLCNPANSDLYTTSMARFVEAFATKVTPAGYKHHFWIAGGALAVENTLKTAFDWKARKLGRTSMTDSVNDLSILHFREAFHGRSGYTMSLTNTVPEKTGLFPQFDWPRVHNPGIEFDLEGGIANDIEASEAKACEEIEKAFAERGNTIAAILIEPMQGEGGDNHFRPEFLAKLREYADEHEALLIFDEVQTGFWSGGKNPWLWQDKGVAPDLVAFSKKTQVAGFYSNDRVLEVENNVFEMSSRINSTWGGNLVDMVRCRRFIEIILEEKLGEKVGERGEQMIRGLRGLAGEHGGIHNVRGQGSLVAFTLESGEVRDKMLSDLASKNVLALASGPEAVRFRLPYVIGEAEIDTALERIADCLPARV